MQSSSSRHASLRLSACSPGPTPPIPSGKPCTTTALLSTPTPTLSSSLKTPYARHSSKLTQVRNAAPSSRRNSRLITIMPLPGASNTTFPSPTFPCFCSPPPPAAYAASFPIPPALRPISSGLPPSTSSLKNLFFTPTGPSLHPTPLNHLL